MFGGFVVMLQNVNVSERLNDLCEVMFGNTVLYFKC